MKSHLTIRSAIAISPRKSAANAATVDATSQKLEPRPMAAVATLKVKIDQQLARRLMRDGDGWDLRGRWDDLAPAFPDTAYAQCSAGCSG